MLWSLGTVQVHLWSLFIKMCSTKFLMESAGSINPQRNTGRCRKVCRKNMGLVDMKQILTSLLGPGLQKECRKKMA